MTLKVNRRSAIIGLSATLATPAIAQVQLPAANQAAAARRNASSFVTQDWRDHF